MKRLYFVVWYVFALIVSGFLVVSVSRSVLAQTARSVPEQYYANYKIAGTREKMIQTLEQIEASAWIGKSVPAGSFLELNQVFSQVTPYLPKSPSNNRTYQQCLLATQDLANEVNTYWYTVFKEKCFSPFGQIVQQIQSKYTVKPAITANPTEWAASLNVTLDARWSIDPSNDTIPSENFFWYYKDVRGNDRVIWKWPVINHTFTEAGRHIVHLTVRSANRQEEGIFDGQSSIAINVAPPAAQIILFINGIKADVDRMTKIGMQDGDTIVTLDAQATRPIGQRTIVSHTREITSNNKTPYQFKDTNEWAPQELVHRFPAQWIYTVKLEVEDNEKNKLQETYKISISDPVAIIRANTDQWTTATKFVFDGSASYSMTARIRKYQRQIVDPSWNQISLVDWKEIKQQFVKPWLYTIKLTVTDTSGVTSSDTMSLQVGSTPPVPSFTVTPSSELKYPSRFILDAIWTYDEDVRNGWDALTYAWSFSSSENVVLDTSQVNSSRIVVTMNAPWTYKARLTVTDRFGETSAIEKDIVVESTLRPEMIITPLVWRWEEEVTFYSKVNEPVSFYERDFGDWKKQQTQEPKVTYTYSKAWIYTVSLRVMNDKQRENILKKQVFMWQKDSPLVARTVKWWPENLELIPTWTCPVGTWLVSAFTVDRYGQILIDASASRSVLGTPSWVRVLFRPQNDEIHSKSVLNYKFSELWCQWVEVTVDDTDSWKSAKEVIRFDVRNALPTMQNLTLQFPQTNAQQGQSVGIGLSPISVADEWLSLDTTLWSIVVKATVQAPRDPDGSISYFRRWYYPNNDDTKKEWFKITPAAITTVTFVIPKPWSPTEYAFVVEAVDNDWWKQSSETLLGKWPIVFFPPGEVQLDQPLVSLQVNSLNVKAWEPVKLTVQATVPSERPDFESNRIIKYDFDGDGIYDQTTKKTEVEHTYIKPWTYSPKVAVYYRDRAWVAFSEKITVIKSVTPRLLYAVHDRGVLVRDVTLGDIEQRTICMDTDACFWTWTDQWSGMHSFFYAYPTYWEVSPRISIVDTYGNELEKQDRVTLREETGFWLLSVPEAIWNPTSWHYEVALSEAMQNTRSVYLLDTKNCYIDADITKDGDGDGDPWNDYDVTCNRIAELQFTPTQKTIQGQLNRVVENNKVQTTPIIISFIDLEDDTYVPDEYKNLAEQIDQLIAHVPSSSPDTYVWYYRDSLITLKASLADSSEKRARVIELRDLVWNYPYVVPAQDKETLAFLLNTLSDSTVKSAFWWTVYDTQKNEILLLFQEPDKTDIEGLFEQFESVQWNQSEMKKILDTINQRALEAKSQWLLDDVDVNVIRNALCTLIIYYELPSKTCSGEVPTYTTEDELKALENIKETTNKSSSTLWTILKWVLRIVIILAVWFGVVILIFAIKAKQQQRELQQEDENSP